MPGFATFDQLIAALTSGQRNAMPFCKTYSAASAGVWASLWGRAGIPTAGAWAGTSLAAQVQDNTVAGGLSLPAPGGSFTQHFVNFQLAGGVSGGIGVWYVMDRLLMYPNINMNSNALQTLNNTNTLTRYTTGAGVMMFMEVTTGLGASAPVVTVIYTNQSGTASQSTSFTSVASTVANNIPCSTLFIPLASGDTGVRSVQSVQLASATGAGAAALVLAKPMFMMPALSAGNLGSRELVGALPSLEQLFDNHCLMMAGAFTAAVTNGVVIGNMLAAYN